MIRKRKLFPVLLVAGLAVSSLLLLYRAENPVAPEPVELPGNYFFHGARMTLTGEDGQTAMEIQAGSANRGRDNPALTLRKVAIRRGDPPTVSMVADSALLPRQGADLSAEGNLRLTFGPAGAWVARADHARMTENGASITLTGSVSFRRAGDGRDGPSISGEHLVLDVEGMVARTESPVRVRIGEVVFAANGLSARVADETITLDSNVQAIINP